MPLVAWAFKSRHGLEWIGQPLPDIKGAKHENSENSEISNIEFCVLYQVSMSMHQSRLFISLKPLFLDACACATGISHVNAEKVSKHQPKNQEKKLCNEKKKRGYQLQHAQTTHRMQ